MTVGRGLGSGERMEPFKSSVAGKDATLLDPLGSSVPLLGYGRNCFLLCGFVQNPCNLASIALKPLRLGILICANVLAFSSVVSLTILLRWSKYAVTA